MNSWYHASLLNKVHVDFWEGMHLVVGKCMIALPMWKLVVFMACILPHQKFQQESHYTSLYKHLQIK